MQNRNDLRRKIVIDINSAQKLGNVNDIDVDVETGKIISIILPPKDIISNLFLKGRERIIPWSAVRAVGGEFILVDLGGISELLP